MLAGDQTDKSHQLARRVKAGEVPQFSQCRAVSVSTPRRAINPRVSPSRDHPSSVCCSAWSSPLIREKGSHDWRVVFRFEGVRFCDVDLIDYHQEDPDMR